MEMNRRGFLASAAMVAPLLATFPSETSAASTNKKRRACVIGDTHQGGYGHRLHLMWSLRDDVEVAGLADPDEEGRTQHAAEAGAKRAYADYRVMLEREKPDLVSIGPRWTVNHKDYLLACAEVGAHGLMEKPLAPDLAEADAMIDAVDSKNLKWAMAFNFRASPVARHARRLIMEENLIGDILEIRSRGKEDHRAGGEDLIVLGVHIFDLMAFFLGPPRWCSADITVNGRPATKDDVREATEPLGPVAGDRVHATYGFANGVNGYFSTMKNRHGNGGRWGMEIYGSKGIVTIRMTTVPEVYLLRDPTWAPGGKSVAWEPLPGTPTVDLKNSKVGHYSPIVDDLIAAIDEDRRPRVSLRDGRIATEMIQAVFESHVQGRPVQVPLKQRDHPLKRWTRGAA